jgi:hypothetical protein
VHDEEHGCGGEARLDTLVGGSLPVVAIVHLLRLRTSSAAMGQQRWGIACAQPLTVLQQLLLPESVWVVTGGCNNMQWKAVLTLWERVDSLLDGVLLYAGPDLDRFDVLVVCVSDLREV